MHFLRYVLPTISFYTTITLAESLTGTYPPPLDLSSDQSIVPTAWKNLTATLNAYLKENKTSGLETLAGAENVTFSLGLFSLHDPAATRFQYHYASPETLNAVNGTNKVDGDSIYHMASVTKLFTVFAGLLEMTDAQWNTPLTEVFPTLAEYARKQPGEENPTSTIQWENVTPWAIANHLSGFPGGGLPGLDLLSITAAQGDVNAYATAFGFPPVDLNELGPCWTLSNPSDCPADELIKEASTLAPNFLPWSSPSYANTGLILLGLTISNITGRPWTTMYNESIFQPLKMTSSRPSDTPPASEEELARSVIVGDLATWLLPGGISTPSGGLLSTVNDLSKFGVNILNSTLLTKTRTRKWMKPTTLTPSLSYAVGAPWEIIRYIHPSTGKVTDLYTKLGDSGPYGGDLVIIPEYGAGFSFLNGAANETVRSNAALAILDQVGEAVIPALEAQAAAEATRNYVGTYVSTDPDLNSSVTVSFNESTVPGSAFGLSLSGWISNGTDALAFFGGGDVPRLLPSIPNQSEGAGKVAFKATTNPQLNSYVAASDAGIGPWTGFFTSNGDWILGDDLGFYYDKRAANLFVFEVDGDGRATAVTPAVTKLRLERRK